MISRVAEACFWLHRYVERAENTARLLQVNRSFLLDVRVPIGDRWMPVIVVSGEQERFASMFSEEAANDGELVQEYLTWNDNNPVSIATSIKWARENARSIREVISLELWQAINSMWHWLRSAAARREYRNDRDAFYARVKEFSALFQGIGHSTMLQEHPFDFMRMGMMLERAGQTARIVDVKYHAVNGLPGGETRDAAVEAAQCLAMLRSCSASEPFSKKVRRTPRGDTVAAFLVLDVAFPRSVYYCIDRAYDFLQRVREGADPQVAARSAGLLGGLRDSLREHSAASLLETGVHQELTRVIDTTAGVCQEMQAELFDPVFDPPSQSAGVES